MPKSILEMMAMARPVITTDIPGCREAVINERNGYLIEFKCAVAECPKCLKRIILRIIQSMENGSNFINDLNDHYFWDVDIARLDPEKSKRLIIERVFSLGAIEDIRAIINYYGASEVAEQLADLNYLDPKTLNFASVLFEKPKEEFKCSTSKPSTKKYWNS